MPALTPNRLYPYPVPADPADVPTRLQRLAEAVDTDLNTLNFITRPRPMAQFVGNVTNTIPGTSTSGTFTWQLTDFNTRSWQTPPDTLQNDVTAIDPITGTNTTQLTVSYTGFWYILASAQLNTGIPGDGIDMVGMEIVTPGGVVARNTLHDKDFLADVTHIIDVSTAVHLTAGSQVSLRGVVGRAASANPVSFGQRSITFLRMTET